MPLIDLLHLVCRKCKANSFLDDFKVYLSKEKQNYFLRISEQRERILASVPFSELSLKATLDKNQLLVLALLKFRQSFLKQMFG